MRKRTRFAQRETEPSLLAPGMHVLAQYLATEYAARGQLAAARAAKFYPGVLIREQAPGMWAVNYDDGDDEVVAEEYIVGV